MSAVERPAVPSFERHCDTAALTAALYPRIRYMGSKYDP
jgi:hypothetical protein